MTFDREKRQRLFERGERASACQDTASPFASGLYEVEAAARADEREKVLAEVRQLWMAHPGLTVDPIIEIIRSSK